MSKDFDAALADALDHTARTAHTAGPTAARIRGRKRTMRKRIALSTVSLALAAVGTTAAFTAISSPGGRTPQPVTGSPSVSASPSRAAVSTTGPAPGPTGTSATGSASTGSPGSTGPGSTGSTGTGAAGSTSISPSGTGTGGTGTAEPFPGIWDITTWQQYRAAQAAVEQGHQPWLLDPTAVVTAWGTDSAGAPVVHQLSTDVFQVTKAGAGIYTVRGTCPDPGSAAPIWVITSITAD